MSNRGQQVSVTAQENLKLAAFLFHHRWRYIFDWEVMGVHEDTVYLLEGQNWLKDEYEDSGILPKVNKANMARPSKSISDHVMLPKDSLLQIDNQENHTSPDLW